jgi:hypothetical protein
VNDVRLLLIVLLGGCDAALAKHEHEMPDGGAKASDAGLAGDLGSAVGDLASSSGDLGSATGDLAAWAGDLASSSGGSAHILYQCTGLGGGICLMNSDGSGVQQLRSTGRSPDENAAGDILFHDDTYTVQKRQANGTVGSLGAGAFARWRRSGGILFQCSGLGGGICLMNADGGGGQQLLTTGRSPDENAAGDILFHDDTYKVQKRLAGGTVVPLGDGAFPRFAPDGSILFQCSGLGGGICAMDADGSNRRQILASGRNPDENAAGDILYHDDTYTLHERFADGTSRSFGAGAFGRFVR